MAIYQTLTTSFKKEVLQAVHNFDVDTFKLALYTSTASLGPTTTAYSSTDETSGTGYVAGGVVLTGVSVAEEGEVVFVVFTDAVWPTANFVARGGLIYNSSKGNKAVAVLDFGADKTPTTSLTVRMPPATATAALIRLP